VSIILCALDNSSVDFILFNLACVLNVITHKHAYALFPLSTFERFEAVEIYHLEGNNLAAIEKYVNRGWTIVPRLHGLEWEVLGRRVGDSACWKIPLQNSPGKTDTLTINSWHRYDFLFGQSAFSNQLFSYSGFRYSYLVIMKNIENCIKEKVETLQR
jgi:hypothetical protein